MTQTEQVTIRHCQPCTACCDGWVRIAIEGMEVYPGHPCPHSTGSGCRIYAQRPVDPCVKFECGWKLASSPLPDWLRPDQAQVMVLPAVRAWNGLPVDVAVPVGPRISPDALDWLKRHAMEARRPLIYLEQCGDAGLQRMQDAIAYGPPAFQADVARRIAAGERFW